MSTHPSNSGSSDEAADIQYEISPRPSKRRRISNEVQPNCDSSHVDGDILERSSPAPQNSPPVYDVPSRIRKVFRENKDAALQALKSSALAAQPNKPVTSKSFSSIPLSPWLHNTLRILSINNPTPVQLSTIPPILTGSDVLASSPTGTGKTLAFALPILHAWSADPFGIYALILTPTRELALQIFEQFSALGAAQDLKVVLVTGGSEMRPQALALERRPHLVVATPGRLADHIRQSGKDTVSGLKRVKVVVLDEADRLLDRQARMLEDVGTCLGALPPRTDRQTLCYTATMTEEVRALRNLTKSNGRRVFLCESSPEQNASLTATTSASTDNEGESALSSITQPNSANNPHATFPHSIIPGSITQTYLTTPSPHKTAYLHILLSTPLLIPKQTIIFTNRTTTADLLHRTLLTLHHSTTALHSSLPQSTRNRNLSDFRARKARVLVATDVAGRGLDIPGVGVVVNFDVPRNPRDYVHRVGRTGRMGGAGSPVGDGGGGEAAKGLSITLVGARDVGLILAIEARTGVRMAQYVEEGVNVETRVVKEGGRVLKEVGVARMEALRLMEGGREVGGRVKRLRKER